MRRFLLWSSSLFILIAGCRGNSVPPLTASATSAAAPATVPATIPHFSTPSPATVITAGNTRSLHATASFRATLVQRLAWSSNGALLWVIGTGTVDQIDANTGDAKRVLAVQPPERVLAVLPTAVAVTAGGPDAPVELIDVASGKTLYSLQPGGYVAAATAFGGDRLVLISGDAIKASVWDTTSGQQVGTLSGFQTGAPVFNVVVDDAGNRAAWVARGTLQFSDVRSNVLGARVSFEDFIGSYSFAPDGRTFATTTAVEVNGTTASRVQLWDPATGREALRITQPAPFVTLGYAPVQPLIATGGSGFALWSTTDGKLAGGVAAAAAGQVQLVSFSPDGTLLVTVDNAGEVRLWRSG